MFVRNDENVRRRDGMRVAERGHLFIAVDNRRVGFVVYDLAKDA